MLEIKPKYNIDLPALPPIQLQAIPVEFDPPVEEDDELIQAIEEETTSQDVWQLQERPDPTELESYWRKVEADIQNDPEWVWMNDEAEA